MVNTVLQNLGVILKPIKFLDSDSHTYIAMLLWSTWKGLGWGAIMYLASIAGIDQEMYEAARVDGANAVVQFFKITLPYMLFVTTPYLITQFIGNINNFNVIYLLTKGAPAALSYNNGTAGKTDLLVTWLYKLTMDFKDYNYAAVISIMVFILSAVFSLWAYHKTGALKNEEGFQ